MFRVEVKDKQVYNIAAGDHVIMEYCELLNQNNLSLLEIQEWLIDGNLAVTYLLTNFLLH